MPEKLVTVATFSEPLEAHMARARLEADGIRAFVTGDETNALFAGSRSFGVAEVQVSEADAQRAAAVLADVADEEEVRATGAGGDPVWLCPLCGEAVAERKVECPYCRTPRGDAPAVDAIQERPARPWRQQAGVRPDALQRSGDFGADAPAPAPQPGAVPDPDIEVPPLRTMVGDERARRALRAALFGWLFLPLLPYSVWQVLGLLSYAGELSPAGRRDLRLALLLNGALAAAVVLFCCGVLGRYD